MLGRKLIILTLLGVFNLNIIRGEEAGTPMETLGTAAGTPAGTPAQTSAGKPAETSAGTPAGTPAGTLAGTPAGASAGTSAGISAEFKKISFVGKNLDDQFCIEELSADKYPKAIKLLKERVPEEDPTLFLSGVSNDERSIDILQDIWTEILMKNMSLVCFKCNSDEMVGLNLLYMKRKNTMNVVPRGFTAQLMNVHRFMSHIKRIDIAEIYNVDKFLSSSLYVIPKYRNIGVEQKLLMAGQQVCEKYNSNLISSHFVMDYENKAADDVGYTTIAGISYKKLAKKYKPASQVLEKKGLYHKVKWYCPCHHSKNIEVINIS